VCVTTFGHKVAIEGDDNIVFFKIDRRALGNRLPAGFRWKFWLAPEWMHQMVALDGQYNRDWATAMRRIIEDELNVVG